MVDWVLHRGFQYSGDVDLKIATMLEISRLGKVHVEFDADRT
jgi:hypothetical protein